MKGVLDVGTGKSCQFNAEAFRGREAQTNVRRRKSRPEGRARYLFMLEGP